MSVRIENDVVELITALKEMYNLSNMSEAIRVGLLHGYPELPDIIEEMRQKESERVAILKRYKEKSS